MQIAVVGALISACSSTPEAGSSSSVMDPSTTVVVSTAEATVTDVVISPEDDLTTQSRPTSPHPAKGGTPAPTGGDDDTGGTPNPCPDPATLGAVTPDYDPSYPINAVNCAGEWAVGTYEAHGSNQTTGIWRNSGSGWVYQDRNWICAQADNIPPELYGQACTSD